MYSKYIGMLYMSVYYMQVFVLYQCTYLQPIHVQSNLANTYVHECVTLLVIGTGGVGIKQTCTSQGTH